MNKESVIASIVVAGLFSLVVWVKAYTLWHSGQQ
jgi:hypothetical protein